MNEIIINSITREKRAAIIEDGKITKLMIQQPQEKSKVGNIYLGKVANVKAGMNASFIDIGEGKHGYIHRDQLPSYLHNEEPNKHLFPVSKFISQGAQLLVQVKKDETDIKGPMLTAVIEIAGEKMVYLPQGKYIAVSKKGESGVKEVWRKLAKDQQRGNEGFIIRTSSFHSDKEQWLNELERLRHTYEKLMVKASDSKAPACLFDQSALEEAVFKEMQRLKNGLIYSDDGAVLKGFKERMADWPEFKWNFELYQRDENIFSYYKAETELDKALKRIIWLENGSYLVIDETEALVSIDVNTGKFSGTKNLEDTVLKTNLAAAKEIGRQLVLRDYGGMILIDFIDMKNQGDQQKVKNAIQHALEKGDKQFRIEGFTSLGILQITRKRTKSSLSEALLMPCPVCKGKGKVESPETLAFRLERELWEKPFREHEGVLIEMTEDVKTAFCGNDNLHLERIEKSLNVKIFFSIVKQNIPCCHIRKFGTEKELSKDIV
ncbi:Rne/Rng family ribonuclease [Heyndrickxia acidicola]|uniref:Rne/Rng family ribonuclease n=1 Tax=Heyndrickxia acidicola TaxID=209389 RepID=A0ABU6MJD6_9BACI|nr:Rne/Rng family ribonuclease [Heyndrickxia acidicola]MED1204784.1 Rne/Rng family ribonuclease [Heyndrickxia acidicola]